MKKFHAKSLVSGVIMGTLGKFHQSELELLATLL